MSRSLEQTDPAKLNHSEDKYLLPPVNNNGSNWLKSQATIVVATIVIALATAIYAGVTFFQWRALRRQVSAMETQAAKMDDQLGLASQQLNLMRQSLQETKASNENARDANRLANKSLLETQKSVVIAQRSLELSEQAAVSVQDVMMESSPLEAGKELAVTFILINKGRTNALNPFKNGYVVIGTEKNHSGDGGTTLTGGSPIAPEISSVVTFSRAAISQQEVDAINSGFKRIYAYLNVAYRDVFTHEHQFEECRYYEPKLKRFVYCHLHSHIIK